MPPTRATPSTPIAPPNTAPLTPTSTTRSSGKSINYMHCSRAEHQAFVERLKGKAKEHDNKNVIIVYKTAVNGTAHALGGQALLDANEDPTTSF